MDWSFSQFLVEDTKLVTIQNSLLKMLSKRIFKVSGIQAEQLANDLGQLKQRGAKKLAMFFHDVAKRKDEDDSNVFMFERDASPYVLESGVKVTWDDLSRWIRELAKAR